MEKFLKNKKMIIAIIAVLLLIAIWILIVAYNKQPGIFAKVMFEDIKTGDIKKITNYLGNETIQNDESSEKDSEGSKEFEILLSKMEYKIISSKKSGNTGKVIVQVTNRDIEATLKNYFSTAFSEMLKNITSTTDSSDLQSKLESYLKTEYENAKEITTEIEINLVKEHDGWKVQEDKENINKILNAILPGYLEYVNGAVSSQY